MGDVITYPLEQVNSSIPIGTNGQTVRYVGHILTPTSFLYNSGSRIGIGLTNPAYTLDVLGTGNFSGALTAASLGVTSVNTANLIGSKWYPSADSATALQILKANGTTSIVNIDTTNSRVGIGNVAPIQALDVTGSIYVSGSFIAGNMAYGGQVIHNSGATNMIIRSSNATLGDISFQTGGTTDRMRLLANGNFGIGISPSYLLDVNGLARFSTGFLSPKWYPVSDSTTAIQINKANGTTNVMTVDTTNGRVGINKANPAYTLDVNGDISIPILNALRTGTNTVLRQNSGNFDFGYIGSNSYVTLNTSNEFIVRLTNTIRLYINNSGLIGIGTTSPTAKVSVAEKTAMTETGAVMIMLTNKTGANSVKGTVVSVSDTTDNAFRVNPIDGDMPIGVVYTDGIADGSECWVVISGIAEVLLVNTVASTRSYVAYSSGTTAGRIDTSATIPAASQHFREIGHTLESKTGGTNVLCKCILHFN